MGMETEAVQQVTNYVAQGEKILTEGVEIAEKVGTPIAKGATKAVEMLWEFTMDRMHSYKHLAKNNPVSFLYIKDGVSAEESKKILLRLEQYLKAAGVKWAYTKIDVEANGVPTSVAYRASDQAKIEDIMARTDMKDYMAFNLTPSLEDFDPSIPKEDIQRGIDSNKKVQEDRQSRKDVGRFLKDGLANKKQEEKLKIQSEKVAKEIKSPSAHKDIKTPEVGKGR